MYWFSMSAAQAAVLSDDQWEPGAESSSGEELAGAAVEVHVHKLHKLGALHYALEETQCDYR